MTKKKHLQILMLHLPHSKSINRIETETYQIQNLWVIDKYKEERY